MNKQTMILTGVLSSTAWIGVMCLAQPASVWSTPETKSTLQRGTLKITPSQQKDSFTIEVNDAPLESVFQAIAEQAKRKIVMSDEVAQTIKKSTITRFNVDSEGNWFTVPFEGTADKAMEFFSRNQFSWGKVGQDAYLLVPREKSSIEAAFEGKHYTIGPAGKVTILPQPKIEPKQQNPQKEAPHKQPVRAGIHLLTPEKK